MQEQLVERIQVLERAVQRWKAVSLTLFLILLSGMIVGGGIGLLIALKEVRQDRAMEMVRMEELRAREMAVQAQREADAAVLRGEQMRKKADPAAPPDDEP
jgi:hypothetical protein